MTVMENLRAIRLEHGLTMKELADRAGITESYVSRLEAGKRTNPSRRVLQRLAHALEVPLSSIVN